ncbi:transposase [Qipengyuania sp. GH38]|nr:transposase [Qipengyuania intermedia]
MNARLDSRRSGEAFHETLNGVDFLNIPDCVTTSVDDSGPKTWVNAILVRPIRHHCPACGERALSHGTIEQTYADRPIGGRPVRLRVEIPRGRCRNAGCATNTFQFKSADHFDGTMTGRCRRYIEDNCFKYAFTEVARQTGVPEATVRRIADRLLTKLDQNFRIDTPKVLAIDEIHLASGKDPKVASVRAHFPERKSKICRTVISNGLNAQVVELLPDRRMQTLRYYLESVEGYRNIKYVTIDMADDFRRVIKKVFGERVTVIADRWHVAQKILEVVTDCRRSIEDDKVRVRARDLSLALNSRRKRLEFKSPKVARKVDFLLQDAPDLKQIYEAKEQFLDIYDSNSASQAKKRYADWLSGLSLKQKHAFRNVIAKISNWYEEIFAYWELGFRTKKNGSQVLTKWHGQSNAVAEAKNRQIRHINRIGRSYSHRFLRARAIFSNYDVAHNFGICANCRLAFKRVPSARNRKREEAAWARGQRDDFNPQTYCRECDPASTGVTRPGDKPVQSFVTRCGLADIWTEKEESLLIRPKQVALL